MAIEMQLPFLGQIPLDYRLAKSCDEGDDFIEAHPESRTAKAFVHLVKGEIVWYFLIIY